MCCRVFQHLLASIVIMSWAVTTTALPVQKVEGPKTAKETQATKEQIKATNSKCMNCHEEEDLGKIVFSNGKDKSVFVNQSDWDKSIHGDKLFCTDCHRDISKQPHAKVKSESAREYRWTKSETCQRCHYAQYTRGLDGIHYQLLQDGVRAAPNCVDCHGGHNVQPAKTPRIAISNRCKKCHEEVYEEYQNSIHGKALLEENNQDVPVCTDCHGAHSIAATTEGNFAVNSYKLCANCHGDAKKMEPYQLNTAVLTTYLDDFHGASNKLYSMGAGTPGKPIATCSDCHGIHDIQSFRSGAKNQAPPQERIVNTCRKCHKDAPVSFAKAWLSHYEPTLASAPLVWIIKWTYRIMIPLMLLGLVLHILLHLWCLRKHR